MRTMLGIAFVIVGLGALTAGRAEAQTACGYGVVCVYTVPVGTPSPAVVAAPVAPGVQVLDPELAAVAPATHTRPRWGLLVTGLSMFVGGYALTIALDHADGSFGWSLVPIAGPFISMSEGSNFLTFPLFIVAGALQIAGTVLTIVGAASRVEVPAERPAVAVVPYASGDGAGLAASARF